MTATILPRLPLPRPRAVTAAAGGLALAAASLAWAFAPADEAAPALAPESAGAAPALETAATAAQTPWVLEARPPELGPLPAPSAVDPGRREVAALPSAGGAANPAPGLNRDTLALEHGVRIRAHMMRSLAYPADIRTPGRVVVALTLASDGALLDARVIEREAAGPQATAALAAARAAAPYPSAPEALGTEPLSYDVRVSFRRR